MSVITIEEAIAQDNLLFLKGPPTLSLQAFVDDVLSKVQRNSLQVLYSLIEAHGMAISDKVIEGSIVLPSGLLAALRDREQQIELDDSEFWATLITERRYSVFRNAVEQAYRDAGKSKYYWLNWNNQFVELDIENHNDSSIQPGLNEKRVEIVKNFIEYLWKCAKANNVEFDPHRLPITKAQLLEQLKKRYRKEFSIQERTFTDVWMIVTKVSICSIPSSSTTEKGKIFLSSIKL